MGKLGKSKKGFTLIELLMVMALIGILVAIIYVSLRNSVIRSKNSRIATDVAEIRKIAQGLYLSSSDGYTSLCVSDGTSLNRTNQDLDDLQEDIEGLGGSIKSCWANVESYCLTVNLAQNRGFLCIDDEGRFSSLLSSEPNPCVDANSSCP
jgi:type IV pilus assembly protein PilE